MIALKKTAFEIPLPVFIAAIVVGAGIITTTGLLTGLVARPANCIKRTTVEPPTTRVSGSSASVTTSAQSGSSTTRTSVASTVTSTAATTRTSTAATTRTSTAATTRTSTAATTRTSTAATTRTSVASTVTSTAATTRTSTAATTRTSTAATTRTSTAATTRTSVASSATTRTSIASSSSSAAPITGSVTTRQGTTILTLPTLTSASLPSTRPTTGPANTTVYRLPKTVSPSRYDLLLRFDFDPYNATASENSPTLLAYTGEVTIALTATQATNRIILHMDRNLVLTEAATVTNTDTSTPVTVTNSAYDNYQWYDLNLADNLVVGTNYAIALKFRGSTSRDGLYFHGYLEGNTKQRSVLGTRFLPNFARTAFPCFDEPGFKAIFAITIEHPATSKALSNFPELTSTPFVDAGKNKLRTVFTPSSFVMSPYQVGWAVVPDEFTSQQRAIAALGTTVSVWGRPSEISRNMGDFALEVAEASLTYMSIYSGGVNAPIPPKIDFVALPFFPDISSPSWGLNGFREDDIYYLDNENSKKDRQFIALIVAKEMAHIWFGNYITAEFWDDVWIQEGLAQLFQYRAIDATYPDWEIQNQFLVDVTMPALWRDGYEAAQPLKFEIHESVELKFLFTDLMYKKSAAIMRMFASAYGETAFKDGLTTLLTNNGFKSVNIDSFTAAFTAPNGWTISTKEYLEPWVTLDNAPEVVILMSVGGGVTNVSFVQARFLLSSIEFEPDSSKHIWPVYLNCKAGGVVGNPLGGAVVDFQFLLTGERDSYQLNAAYNWIKCNRDFDGYYISDYYKTLWESFEAVLLSSPETFSVGDRVHLIHSSFELAWLGTHSYSIPAYIIVYMESKETNLSPWRALIYHVNKLAVITEHRTSFRNLRASISITLLDAISRFGFDIYTDSTIHTEELLKLEFLDTLGRLQNVDALNNFTDLFKKIDGDYFIDPDHVGITLSSNLRALVYKYHLQNTYDFTDWFTIYTFYGITNDLREKEYAIDALANTRLTWLFDYQLDEVLFSADNHIPIEDAPRMISAIGNNPTGRYFAWYFVREYWGDLYLKGADMRKVTEAVNDITNSFDNLLLVDEVNSFFLTSYDFEAGDIREYISQTILENFLWTVDREADFKTYFFEIPRKQVQTRMIHLLYAQNK